jgi:hypothetical protein
MTNKTTQRKKEVSVNKKETKEVKVSSIEEALELLEKGEIRQLDFDSNGNLKKAYSETVG